MLFYDAPLFRGSPAPIGRVCHDRRYLIAETCTRCQWCRNSLSSLSAAAAAAWFQRVFRSVAGTGACRTALS